MQGKVECMYVCMYVGLVDKDDDDAPASKVIC